MFAGGVRELVSGRKARRSVARTLSLRVFLRPCRNFMCANQSGFSFPIPRIRTAYAMTEVAFCCTRSFSLCIGPNGHFLVSLTKRTVCVDPTGFQLACMRTLYESILRLFFVGMNKNIVCNDLAVFFFY